MQVGYWNFGGLIRRCSRRRSSSLGLRLMASPPPDVAIDLSCSQPDQKNLIKQWNEHCFLVGRSVLFRRYREIYDLDLGYFEINIKNRSS